MAAEEPVVETPPPPVTPPPVTSKQERPKPPKPEKDKEEEFWKEAEHAKSYVMYKSYLETFSSGKYVSDAKSALRKVAIDWEFVKKEQGPEGEYYYEIQFYNVEDLSFGSFNEDMIEPEIVGKNKVKVMMIPPVSSEQKLIVKGDYGRRVTIMMNPEITLLTALFKDFEDRIEYEVVGGQPPYYIRLVDAATDKWTCTNQKLDGAKGSLSKEELMKICALDGVYKIHLQDKRKTETKFISELFPFEGKSSNSVYFILGALIILPLVGGIAWFISSKNKEKKRQEYFEKHARKEARKKEAAVAAATTKPAPKKEIRRKEPVPVAKAPEPVVETHEEHLEEASLNDVKKMKINVKKKPVTQKSSSPVPRGKSSGGYHVLPMASRWENSAIENVCMSRSTIYDIDDFIRKENRQGIDEDNSAVPEVGGFLLGNHSYSEKTKQYTVYLEKFVPITPEENDVYKVEFGINAWMELDTVKDDFPDYVVIGWFHTHPGHSLFLSQPDLKIHEGFFKHRFQLAMEIDTLSENLDTGFFTRTIEGKINNTRDAISGSKWFSWSEIEKYLRKKHRS